MAREYHSKMMEQSRVLREIADCREVIDALRASQEQFEAIGDRIADIVHEVNQPLSAISNFASACRHRMMHDASVDQALILSMLDQIIKQSHRAAQTLRQFAQCVQSGLPHRSQDSVDEPRDG